MTSISNNFKDKFGSWALIAGASEGLGAAFAFEAARYGLNVAMIARRKNKMAELGEQIEALYNVQTKSIKIDLSSKNLISKIEKAINGLDIGLVIYNAAVSTIGLFYHFDIDKHLQTIDVNVKGPMLFSYHFGKKMMEREKGGIILMSSLAGLQGNPYHAHYSATRGYTMNLAEALWYEMKKYNVNVMTVPAGPTATPNYINSKPKKAGLINPKPMPPEKVAKGAFKSLLKNKPYHIPGCTNKFYNFIMRKIQSRRSTIKMMGNIASKMYGENKDHSSR